MKSWHLMTYVVGSAKNNLPSPKQGLNLRRIALDPHTVPEVWQLQKLLTLLKQFFPPS